MSDQVSLTLQSNFLCVRNNFFSMCVTAINNYFVNNLSYIVYPHFSYLGTLPAFTEKTFLLRITLLETEKNILTHVVTLQTLKNTRFGS